MLRRYPACRSIPARSASANSCTSPGDLSFSLFLASPDESSAVGEVYSRMLEHSRWHGLTRLVLGPDIAGELATGLMVSLDLPEGALTDLPG